MSGEKSLLECIKRIQYMELYRHISIPGPQLPLAVSGMEEVLKKFEDVVEKRTQKLVSKRHNLLQAAGISHQVRFHSLTGSNFRAGRTMLDAYACIRIPRISSTFGQVLPSCGFTSPKLYLWQTMANLEPSH